MKLTGKAKEVFDKWFVTYTNEQLGSKRDDFADDDDMLDAFYKTLIPPMQWGVYQDWADSLGYEISTGRIFEKVWGADIIVWSNDEVMLWEDEYDTRQEARNAAVEKLNELINNN